MDIFLIVVALGLTTERESCVEILQYKAMFSKSKIVKESDLISLSDATKPLFSAGKELRCGCPFWHDRHIWTIFLYWQN